MFKREVVQEIWRGVDQTFDIVYPTHSIASIKGLRGQFSRHTWKAIQKELQVHGSKWAIYERDVNGDASEFKQYLIEVSTGKIVGDLDDIFKEAKK